VCVEVFVCVCMLGCVGVRRFVFGCVCLWVWVFVWVCVCECVRLCVWVL
jgi:hypothetical protein